MALWYNFHYIQLYQFKRYVFVKKNVCGQDVAEMRLGAQPPHPRIRADTASLPS